MFAPDSDLERVEGQLAFPDCIGTVATKAVFDFLIREFASGRFMKIVRNDSFVAHRHIEAIGFWVITHQTLQVMPIALQYPSLHPIADRPANGKGNCIYTVGHAIRALSITSLD